MAEGENKKINNKEMGKVSGGYVVREKQNDGSYKFVVRSNVDDSALIQYDASSIDNVKYTANLKSAGEMDQIVNATSEKKKPK